MLVGGREVISFHEPGSHEINKWLAGLNSSRQPPVVRGGQVTQSPIVFVDGQLLRRMDLPLIQPVCKRVSSVDLQASVSTVEPKRLLS